MHRVQGLRNAHIEKLNILLVEDDMFSSHVVQEMCRRARAGRHLHRNQHSNQHRKQRGRTPPPIRSRKCDYDVTVVTDGRAALAALEESEARPAEERHHLVLSDVVMRDIDGPASASAPLAPLLPYPRRRMLIAADEIAQELLEEVRERYGDSIAFIMLSSAGEEETVMDCIRRGADSYLFKPVRMHEFSSIWQFVMQQRLQVLPAHDRIIPRGSDRIMPRGRS